MNVRLVKKFKDFNEVPCVECGESSIGVWKRKPSKWAHYCLIHLAPKIGLTIEETKEVFGYGETVHNG